MRLHVNVFSPALVFLIFLFLALVHGRWHVLHFSLARVGVFVLVYAFACLCRCSQPVIVLVLSPVLVFVFRMRICTFTMVSSRVFFVLMGLLVCLCFRAIVIACVCSLGSS